MTFVLPPGAAPWWAITVLAVLGAGVGAWLTRVLADASYRRPEERQQPLPRQPWWLVVAVALAWGSLTFRFGGHAQWSLLPAYLYLGAVGAALTFIDLDVHRLPDLLVLPSYPIAFVLLFVPTVVTGQWGALLRGVLAGLALFVGYLIVSVLAAFVIGGVIALILLLARRASRSSHIAFGPSMILGAWVALVFPVMVITG